MFVCASVLTLVCNEWEPLCIFLPPLDLPAAAQPQPRGSETYTILLLEGEPRSF